MLEIKITILVIVSSISFIWSIKALKAVLKDKSTNDFVIQANIQRMAFPNVIFLASTIYCLELVFPGLVNGVMSIFLELLKKI